MKKIIALLLAMLMMVSVLASCGGNTDEGNAGGETTNNFGNEVTQALGILEEDFGGETGATLKVWGPDKYVDLLTRQCKEFTDAFASLNIKVEVVAQGESDAAGNLLNDVEASADVFGIPSDQLNLLASSDVLAAVPKAYADKIAESEVTPAVEASKIDGTLLAYPETDNGYCLVYDKRVVTDEDAKTLEGILEACKKAGKKFIMDAGNGFYSCVYAFTGGVTINGFEEDGVTQAFNEYDKDTAVATLKAFSKLMHDYSGTFASLTTADIPSGFSTDTVAAGIDGSWDAAANKDALGENLGAAKLPTINVNGEDRQMISLYGYKMIGVNKYSKSPFTAQVLAYFLSSAHCQEQRLNEMGWSPTNKDLVASDTVKNDAITAAIVDQGNYSIPQTNMADQFWTPMGALGSELVAEDTNPETYDFATLLDTTVKGVRNE